MKYYRDAVYINMLAVLRYIIRYKSTHDGNTPTTRMIQQGCGLSSTSMVQFYKQKLEEQGLITFDRRSIRVIGGSWTYRSMDPEYFSPEAQGRTEYTGY